MALKLSCYIVPELARTGVFQLARSSTDSDEENVSNTTTDSPGGSGNVQNVAVFSVLGGVLFIVLCVLVAVTIFCVRRATHNETQGQGVSNPTYEG